MKKGSTTGGGGGGGGDRRQETGEDIFFVWPSSLDYLPFDLLSIGNVTGRGALFPRPEIFVASFAGAGRLNKRGKTNWE